MIYSNEFKEAVNFSKKENLFLGFGNPNAKILVIGKEHFFDHTSEKNTEEFYEEILDLRKNENQKNVDAWEDIIKNQIVPNFSVDYIFDDSNPLQAHFNHSKFYILHSKFYILNSTF